MELKSHMSTTPQKEKKQKKIVFSEEIDSRIDGLTLGFAFIAVGLFLLFIPDYFGNKLVGQIVRWVFIAIGGLGLFVEFGKVNPISEIKGFDDLWLGALLLAIWAALYFLTHNFLCNIAGFVCLVLGVYSTFQGLFRIIYSIRLNQKSKTQSKSTIISDILIFLTKVISLVLVVLQLVKAFQQ